MNDPFRSRRHFDQTKELFPISTENPPTTHSFHSCAKFNMSIWNRLRQTFQRNRNWLNPGAVSNEAVKMAIAVCISWTFSDWGATLPQDSATFKELHRLRKTSYSEDDNTLGGGIEGKAVSTTYIVRIGKSPDSCFGA